MNKIILLEKNKTNAAAPIFDGVQDTVVWSCMQGRNFARIWADDDTSPTCAIAMVGGVLPRTGGFAIVSGDAHSRYASRLLRRWKNNVLGGNIIIPHGDGWAEKIESVLGIADGRHTRYATSKTENNFDIAQLDAWSAQLPDGYSIQQIDEQIFDWCRESSWAQDNVGGFASYEEFVTDGYRMGFAVMYNGEPVSVASPYSAYDGGIEIEIDTHEPHRRRGLARACASRLISECLRRGIYPSWDAANTMSVSLAKSLGYIFTDEYCAYFCGC